MMKEESTQYARWLNGELSDEELESLRASGALKELEQIVKMTDQLVLPNYDAETAYQQFQANRPAKQAKVRRLQPAWWIGIAASFLAIALAVFLLSRRDQELIAANKSNATVMLQDGTVIVLNDGSAVVYNEKEWDAVRTVELTGEAYFEVEQQGQAFVVQTKNGAIQVLGTAFNVKAWRNKLLVECYSGRVAVATLSDTTILMPKQLVIAQAGSPHRKLEIENTRPIWQTGFSKLVNESVLDAFAELERQYGVSIRANVRNQSFSGQLPHDDLQQALENICKPFGWQYTIKNPQEIVVTE